MAGSHSVLSDLSLHKLFITWAVFTHHFYNITSAQENYWLIIWMYYSEKINATLNTAEKTLPDELLKVLKQWDRNQ